MEKMKLSGNSYFRIFIAVLFLFLLNIASSKAQVPNQTQFATEADLKKQASKLFEEEKFEEAFPLYTQLTSIYPKDPAYNFRLGVCMLFSIDDKEKPIPYLEYASNKPSVDKEVLYYLARAYHLNYRFDDAIVEYEKYKKVATPAKAEKLQVERQIDMCKSGKMLMKNLSDLIVIDKKQMNKEDFYRAYDISEIGGKLLAKPDVKQFTLPLDKKKKDKSIIYLAGNNNQVFFSSYGEDPAKGKDIYTVKRGPNGDWGTPQNLGSPINTAFDEDYPFLHPNGKYLFFCSKGHNSMGGYDIFKSTFDSKTNTWGQPVNMDFPVNTPDDDILYVTDLQAKQAYFSSARSSSTGKTEVYHINVERKKIDVIVIDGSVLKNRDGQKLDAKITVKDLDNNSVVGIYNAKPNTGEYSINLPNGGKFLFTVESKGFDSQSEVVVMPVQNVFKPLKQEISYKTEDNKLVINTIFDVQNDDSNYLLALKYIKQKAKLDVFGTEAPEPAPAPVAATQPEAKGVYDTDNNPSVAKTNTTHAPTSNISNADAVKIAKKDARELDSTYREARKQADIAYYYANEKNEAAQNKTKEATDLFDEASRTTDPVKKQRILEQANQANKEAEQRNQETVAAINFAKKLNSWAVARQEEAKLSNDYANDLDAAVKAKSPKEAMAKLEVQEKKLEELSKQNSSVPTDLYGLKADADSKKRELDKVNKKIENLKQEISDNKTIEASTKADMEKTRNLDLKKGLQTQIDGTQKDIKEAEKELATNETKSETLTKEYTTLMNQSNMVYSFVQQAKTGSSEDAAKKAATVNKEKLEKDMYEVSKNVSQNKVAGTEVANNTKSSSQNNNPVVKNENTTDNKTATPVVNENPKPIAPVVSNEPIDTSYTYILKNSDKSAPEILSDINKKYTKELSDISKMKGGDLKREEAKTLTLKNWNADLSKLIDKQKEELTPDADANKKAVFAKNIAEAERQLNSLKVQSTENVAKVETLRKKENGTTEVKPVTEIVSGNEPETDVNTKIVDKPLPATASLADVNNHYTEQITKVNTVKDELLREQARIDVLKNWGKAIDRNIAKQKTLQNQTSDKKQKEVCAARILEAQQKASELKVQTNETIAKVETIQKQTNAVAANNNNAVNPANNNVPSANNTNATQPENKNASANNNQPANANQPNNANANTNKSQNQNSNTASAENNPNNNVANTATNTAFRPAVLMKVVDKPLPAKASLTEINKHYADEIAKTNKIENELVREDAKTQVLKYWNIALEKNIEQLKNEQKVVKTQTEKDASAKKIADVQKVSTNLKKQTTETTAKVETLKKQEAVAVNNSVNNANTNSNENTPVTTSNNSSQPNTNTNAPVATNNKIGNNNSSQPNANTNSNTLANNNSTQPTSNNKTESEGSAANAVTANNNNPVNNTHDNSNASQPTNGNPTVENKKIVFKSLDEINKKFNEDIAATNTINNPVEKEEKKTEVLKSWNKAVDEHITKQKTLLAKANTQKDKDTFTKRIADAQKSSATIKKQTTASVAKVETLKKQNGVATNDNNTSGNNSTTSIDNVNSNQPTANNAATAANTNDGNKTNSGIAANKPVANNKSGDNKLAPNESFEQKKTAVYSKAKPIPVDIKLPKGILFQVQIGAFKKPIPQNLFEGITPITGVTATEGYTRYFAGMFVKSSSADNAKAQIQNAGYKDAFVVAYKDGVRIPLDEAKKLIGENPDLIADTKAIEDIKTQQKNNTLVSNTNDVVSNNTTQPKNNNKTNSNNNASSEIVSNPGNTTQQENKSPVTTTNTNTNKANNIPVANNKSAAAENKINNTQPAPLIASSANVNKTENTNSNQSLTYILPANNKKLNDITAVKGLFYTVQIGVFSQEVAPEKLKTNEALYVEKTPTGYMRYNSGIYNDIKDASKSKVRFVELGLIDAFVTVYYNGKRIPLSEAKEMEGRARTEVAAVNSNNSNTTKPVANKVSQPVSNNNTQPVATNNIQPINNNVTETQPTKSSEPIANATNKSAEPVANKTTQPVKNNAVQPVVNNTTQPVTNNNPAIQPVNKASQPVTNSQPVNNNTDIANNVTPISINTTQSEVETLASNTNEQPANKTSEPVVNKTSQPIANKTSQPAPVKASQPVINESNEPDNTNSIINPVAENVTETPVATQPVQPVVFDEKLKNELTNSLIHTVATPDTGIVYKVQIGAFKDDVPVEVANKFLKMKSKGTINFTTENGVTVYTLGNFKDPKEAGKIKSDVEAMNLKDVSIVSYSDGKKLSEDKTNELINHQ